MNGCTIVAGNYLAFARVLAESFLRHHPGATFTVLVIDDPNGDLCDTSEPFQIMRPHDLALPSAEFQKMAMIYSVTEFATALKPFLLQRLLTVADHAVYLDPDIEVFQNFSFVADLARQQGIVLIPHVLSAIPRDGLSPGESRILVSGMFNLGFIAVGKDGADFLAWWGKRLKRDAIVDPCNGLFTDQRWVDFVPTLFQHHVIRDPALNVAYWNLFERPLSEVNGRYEVSGGPLVFFHFSGFDPIRPSLLSKHQGDRPRTLLSENPALSRLCRQYAKKVLAQGYEREQTRPYGYSRLPNGMEIDLAMRRLFREAIHPPDESNEPLPNALDPNETDAFVEWLREPAVVAGGRSKVSRYLVKRWEDRADLRSAFPDPTGVDADRFLQWAAADYDFAQQAPARLRTTRLRASAASGAEHGTQATNGFLVPGVTIAGYFSAELGIGQAGRLVVAGLEESGMPFSTVTYDRTVSSQGHPFQNRGDSEPFDVNIFCVNADDTPTFVRHFGQHRLAGRHNIGVWFWETEQFPATMHQAFNYVDEVWVASEFTRRAVAMATEKPVHLFPLPVLVPGYSTQFTRADLNLPEDFLFLSCFDFCSISQRKNPLGLIDAFTHAFQPGEGASLLIKTMNGSRHIAALEEVRLACADHPDIYVVDRCLPAVKVSGMTQLADCTVSLHRSEGFGLTLAEAMASAKPVIATGYSGNLTFMDVTNSYLVPYEMTSIGRGNAPYPVEGEWAQPSVQAAAELMRDVIDNPAEAAERGRRAQKHIAERHNVSTTASFISARLAEIRG